MRTNPGAGSNNSSSGAAEKARRADPRGELSQQDVNWALGYIAMIENDALALRASNAVQYASTVLQTGLSDTATDFASAEKTETAADPWADFGYYSSGVVTPIKPSTSISGATDGTYTGRVLGALGNGQTVDGTLTLNVSFNTADLDGSIAFTGGNGNATVLGFANPTSVTGNLSGAAYGGNITGTMSGQYFGPNAEQVGGTWNFNVTGGANNGQPATGAFAGKQ